MKNQTMLDVYYDELVDFLEVSFGLPPKTEYTEEIKEGILITKDRETDEVKTIGIVNFKKRAKEEILKGILKQLKMTIPLEITISSDYR